MVLSHTYENEEESRQEFISEWFADALGITITSSFEDMEKEIDELMRIFREDDFNAFAQLTQKQKDFLTYYRGEADKSFLKKDVFKRIKKEQEELKEAKIEKDFDFVAVKNRTYFVSEQRTFGYIKGNKVSVRVEKYLSRGIPRLRYRTNKGHFASPVSK